MTSERVPYLESLGEITYRLENGKPKSRRTMYRTIEFRSRLEVRFAQHLDKMGEGWIYEPRVYGTPGRGYLPDFEIIGSPQPTFIEVKPTLKEVAGAQAKMAVIWETHPDALLIIVCEQDSAFFRARGGGPWERWQERWG